MGFRTSSTGGSGAPRSFGGAQTSASPFTHSQILHLMKTEFARARRYGIPLACVLFGVDRLRELTDIHGTDLRGKINEQFVNMVAERTRDPDHLGLISDDRYLLVLPHTTVDAACAVAERIKREFSNLEVTSKGSVLALSMSVGVASCEDQETLFFDTMLSRAEAALGWARDSGGDAIEVFRRDPYA